MSYKNNKPENNVIYFTPKTNDKKDTPPQKLSSASDNVLNFPTSTSTSAPNPSSKPSKELSKKSTEVFSSSAPPLWMTTGTICLILLAIPLVNHKNPLFKNKSTKEGREIASINQQKILYTLRTNQRRIASVGKKPGIREQFVIQELQSRYKVQWENNQLEYCIVRDDQEPLVLPSMPTLVENYIELFPPHEQIAKASYFSDEMEAYELQDEQGVQVGIVEAVRDQRGRVLSIYTQ